ncbi:MAG: 3-oxoacyl-(acyl-carrier-protein) reductase FabG [candidate division WS2 bacterium]|uniref:3-oxoacyl-[acyl-carrier-protein] reductase n=1 Tax=Psychracetigena formicireducens TaxID=2986056 RepID=A0A9E2F4I6_PSYF1|nr:3-oxoacyl-(acyl-carrier-protein) reductase FabG [Candidatus Psychracetigena formicireducens]MBT9145106.1 3-oxoacyl-(acyl-carrier-protein) reductase FabG [Candidatus Psychracetigena formicireducens]MBT9150286.1 3-oxoacyl-(acyl-carrier-protein) reductase FabG [Candidatus Psychracetigena formicireducens]
MFPEVALVTGGTKGIGRAVTLQLLQEGVKVIALYRGDEKVRGELEREVEERLKTREMGKLLVLKCDISQAEEVKRVISQVKEAYPRIDVLVNNAGITRDGLFLRMKEEDFMAVLNTNFLGAYQITREVLPLMVKVRRGRIINLASVVGIVGNIGQTNYASSKAALIGFTRSLAREVAPFGITVNAIAPGYIETELTGKLPDNIKEEFLKRIPVKRFGKPAEVAGLIKFLTSEEADYITGQVIVIDGGLTA